MDGWLVGRQFGSIVRVQTCYVVGEGVWVDQRRVGVSVGCLVALGIERMQGGGERVYSGKWLSIIHYVQSQSRGVGSAGVFCCVLVCVRIVDYDRHYIFDIIHCYSHMRV